MVVSAEPGRAISEAQLVELLHLVKGADTIELKLTIPENAQWSTLRALDIDPLRAQIRQVMFFDTSALDLFHAGVVVRARRSQQRAGDTAVKLRPVEPSDLPKTLRKLPSFGVEVDALPGGYVCSGSMKGMVEDARVRATMHGERLPRKLFSKEQRAFFKVHAPHGIEIDDLTLLGPVAIHKWKWTPKRSNRPMVAELWHYPDGSQILELSTRCLPGEAHTAAREGMALLRSLGIEISSDQHTKTKTTLEYYSRLVRERQAGS